MTPEDLRADVPATADVAYLNTGASGPSPGKVVDAVAEFQAYHEFEAPANPGMYPAAADAVGAVEATVADFLGAEPHQIALTESTADGINLIAGSIDWRPGDRVVHTDVEHPAGILPWRRLGDVRGVEVEVVEGDRGLFEPEDFAEAVADARLVCLSAVSWNFGTRLPVEEVVDLAKDAGAMVLVDAVQAFGQHPIDVLEWGADFVAASGHKWPLGPWGTGVLYVDDDACERLTPIRIGGGGVTDPLATEYEYEAGAGMFDLSTTSVATYRGLQVALETIEDIGLDAIGRRIERLTNRLKDGIPDERLLSPREHHSGLVSFEVEAPEAFAEELHEAGIVIRDIPDPGCARASIHAFNSEAEIDALLEHV